MARKKPQRTVDPKWIRTKADEAAAAAGYTVDEAAGRKVEAFCSQLLRQSKGAWAGQPFVFMDWQRDLILRVFGWRRPDGRRRFTRAYLEVPKKSGKSSLCSALALYLLVADDEPGACVACAAVDRDQAGIVFDACAELVKASPDLGAELEVIDSRKVIVYRAASARLEAERKKGVASWDAEPRRFDVHGVDVTKRASSLPMQLAILDRIHAVLARVEAQTRPSSRSGPPAPVSGSPIGTAAPCRRTNSSRSRSQAG